MQDRPTAPELLDAMAAELFTDVREWVPRERRFQVLVLANLCAVIARELRVGEGADQADLELFERLGGRTVNEDDVREAARSLAGELRAGRLDAELPAVVAGLREHVGRKLEIARPGYADPP